MKTRLFAVCLPVFMMAGVSTPVEEAEWIHFGLSGKKVSSIDIDWANPDIMFAGAGEGPYRRTNGGGVGIPLTGSVVLKIYGLTGRLVRTLVDPEQKAGFYRVVWDGSDWSNKRVASGVYFCRLAATKGG